MMCVCVACVVCECRVYCVHMCVCMYVFASHAIVIGVIMFELSYKFSRSSCPQSSADRGECQHLDLDFVC